MPPIRNAKFAKPKNAGKTIKRLLGYMGKYKLAFALVFIFIALSALVSVASSSFLSLYLEKFVKENLGATWATFVGAISKPLIVMAIFFLGGVLLSFTYSYIMMLISTSMLKRIRDDMFTHMQTLPISYFDTHTHGELMSRYTNDTDTLREVMSNGIPQLVSSLFTIVGAVTSMIILSWKLTLVIFGALIIVFFLIRFITSRSGKSFRRQQKAIGQVNGYIEEMIEGQRVVKVFCHESAVKKRFEELNEELCSAACSANSYANVLMPIMGNTSHIIYALIAIVGAVLILNGQIAFGTSALISFLLLIRQFFNPITQISQQINAILTGLAGAERIFDMMDTPSEEDEGYVELVNAQIDEDGNIIECQQKTGVWAWKHPHGDGTVTYTKLEGKVEFENVTFGYVPEKTVLKNLTLYARPGEKIAFVGSTGAGKTTIG